MKDFKAILAYLKIYLAVNENDKIYDKDVAEALKIPQMNFATLKRRNSIPYEHIIVFSKKEGLCCGKIFFD
ncbi:MAG: hypothetical protein JKY28_06010 [Sulfurimonas sp.]|nr:hypothetical protein [Sulfurimonas sp.]